MVETNIDFNGRDNTIKSICWILSVISWVVLIITEIIGFSKLNDKYIIWTFYRIPFTDNYHYFLHTYKAARNEIGFYPVCKRLLFTLFLLSFYSSQL